MNICPNIYIDEPGNTGSDILNINQPYFVLSAIHFTNEELACIQKDISYDIGSCIAAWDERERAD